MAANMKLGINLGFATNKYPEPHVWTRIVGEELGLKYVQFVADMLQAFLPDNIIKKEVERINVNKQKYGIEITSTFLSSQTRVNHLFHPDHAQRQEWLEWFKRFADYSADLGAKSTGGHLGILTFDVFDNQARREQVVSEGIKNWQELSWYCKERGMKYMIFEPMSVPREFAYSVAATREIMDRLNENAGIPFKLCLDIGHAPHPDERDPYVWIRELGAISPIIHIQQTELNHSRHWPFTEEYNKAGIIKGEEIVAAFEEHGMDDIEFIFELYHREHWDTDSRIIEDHKKSVNYWRQFITN